MNVFETPRFRVQITGKSAWLEVKERTGWVFRNQHTLPVAPDALGQGEELSGLRAAIEDFEQTRHGDSRLREALTGVRPARAESPKPAIAPHKGSAPKPAGKPGAPGRTSSAKPGFRLPLRPPLAAPLGTE
jgi:hypothetical protein